MSSSISSSSAKFRPITTHSSKKEIVDFKQEAMEIVLGRKFELKLDELNYPTGIMIINNQEVKVADYFEMLNIQQSTLFKTTITRAAAYFMFTLYKAINGKDFDYAFFRENLEGNINRFSGWKINRLIPTWRDVSAQLDGKFLDYYDEYMNGCLSISRFNQSKYNNLSALRITENNLLSEFTAASPQRKADLLQEASCLSSEVRELYFPVAAPPFELIFAIYSLPITTENKIIFAQFSKWTIECFYRMLRYINEMQPASSEENNEIILEHKTKLVNILFDIDWASKDKDEKIRFIRHVMNWFGDKIPEVKNNVIKLCRKKEFSNRSLQEYFLDSIKYPSSLPQFLYGLIDEIPWDNDKIRDDVYAAWKARLAEKSKV